jgi:3-isopropylmalate dehydratase
LTSPPFCLGFDRGFSRNDFGIKCIIAPSFAEIFENNLFKNGMLPVTLPPVECAVLHADAVAELPLEVDLEKLEIRRSNGESPVPFKVDPFRRYCLLEGLDDIALTLLKMENIEKFERKRSKNWPWLDGLGYRKDKALKAGESKDEMAW